MKSRFGSLLLGVLGVTTICSVAVASQIYLEANFEGQVPDAAIGVGGAAVGEPISVDEGITAIVRDTPMLSLSLEIQDADTDYAGSVCFEFVESAEITTGLVTIEADLWFQEFDSYGIYIREQGGGTCSFASLLFYADGSINCVDASLAPYGDIGTYEIGRSYRVVFKFDMDTGTYDVWLDGMLALPGAAHGITGNGIGSVLLGCVNDEDLTGLFNVDNITVSDTFTDVLGTTWGRVKARFLQ